MKSMNVYIFAIGGTGARVLRSLTFCLASGMSRIPVGTTFIPIIIDYDKDNADKTRCIELMNLYRKINFISQNKMTINNEEENFFLSNIRGVNPADNDPSFLFGFGQDIAGAVGSFADYLGYAHMMGELSLTKDLLSSLYNDEDDQSTNTELNLNLGQGFKGNPNIGSLVFENLKDDAQFQQFLNNFDTAIDRAFIIGSVFGGTGSSGLPRLVDAIRYCGRAGFNDALLGSAIVMPYFKVNTPAAGGAIHSNLFNSKQKAALSYYIQEDEHGNSIYDKITASYFIADDNGTTYEHYSEGSDDQKNNAHIVELLSALSIIDFACKNPHNLHKYNEYGLRSDPSGGDSISIKNLYDGEKDFQHIERMTLAFNFHEKYVLSGDISPKEAFYSPRGLEIASCLDNDETIFPTLRKFIEEFNLWIDELSHQSDSFKPFNNKSIINPDNKSVEANDLGDLIIGKIAKRGGLLSKGVSYKDFASSCSENYKKFGKAMNNPDYALLALYYEAAKDSYGYFN